MPALTISIDEEIKKVIEKRAKKNLMTLREQVEDIIRRSAVNYKAGTKTTTKVDDRLVEVFSREMRGRKRKK
jgi:hypothetical protein